MAHVKGDAVQFNAPYSDGTVFPAWRIPRRGDHCHPYPKTYLHRAKVIATGLYTYWSPNAPDPTGAGSGYLPAEITSIKILSVT